MIPKFQLQASSRIINYLQPTIFEELSLLSSKLKSCNLAQGFPDWETPLFVREALANASKLDEHQYTRCGGHLKLIDAIAKNYSEKFNRKINPLTEISVANGATGALANAYCAFINPEDEVIVLEPTFEFHYVEAKLFGAKIKFISLDPPTKNSNEWTINIDKLESLFNKNTRMLVLNTPHNPTGKVFTDSEYRRIIEILNKFPRVIVLSDEVYEYMYYNGAKNIRIGTYPGLWERCISIYSLGKTFSCTGWRIGFALGHESLIRPMVAAQQWINFNVNRPCQVALAEAMQKALEPYENYNSYYEYLSSLFNKKSEFLLKTLKKMPFDVRVLEPEGGYFVLIDISNEISKIPIKYFYKEGTSNDENEVGKNWRDLDNPDYAPDLAFTRMLTIKYGVSPLPLSTFYNISDAKSVKDYKVVNFVRFAICKSDETLNSMKQRLSQKKI